MGKYRLAIVTKPLSWKPDRPDEVPTGLVSSPQVRGEFDDLFPAVREAVALNEKSLAEGGSEWAVVVDPFSPSRRWQAGRICTPVAYKVSVLWRPEGWEPSSPLDVPNCVWKGQAQLDAESLTYARAVETVRGLNQQCIDLSSSMWYVIVAVENEPISQVFAYDPAGTETTTRVRKLHVIRAENGGRGDCSHCPAHSFQCSRADWTTLSQTANDSEVHPLSHTAE
jgi:hypothetical protein